MRLIDADALEDYIDSDESGLLSAREYKRDYIQCIDHMPTIDPVKHGHWIIKGRDNGDCSNCGENVDFPLMCCYGSPSTRYEPYPNCPWCGSSMDEDKKDDES